MIYNPISVTELNKYIKGKFEEDEYFANVLVEGEISNYKHHYTGHLYFTLKDENSLIKCIMFKTYTGHLEFEPKDGMKVMILGSVSVFERDGTYQLYAKAMKQVGMVGDLRAAYEELKQKLEKEGLFDETHKKPVPTYPKVIGVLTSNTGAVIRDIINVSTRRNPNVVIKLFPVPVQGEGAAEKIAKGIEFMNEQKQADVLIIARGGGSLEDLWPFNEEIVARAIYASDLPVISAVGHETDFTISDFVADLRAPTPSAAAELAVPDIAELQLKIEGYQNRYKQALIRKVQLMKLRYEKCMQSRVFTEPLQKINEQYMIMDMKLKTMEHSILQKLQLEKANFQKLVLQLDTLSPLKTLARGYGIVYKQGNRVKNITELKVQDEISIRLQDGEAKAIIVEKN
ncbi:MAG: exodeoxyribonuclease VII large subunit [Clostridia bacterium]|jgi:exodeoxyribonuclease VII large subunit|nr:exodeoxyribonuclease VII large subunit [Clostridia bacterium]MCI9413011.1 exodeoxyribonuclease VII large subunit [Clostridia bacterium]